MGATEVAGSARWHEGWWAGARRIASPNFNERPSGCAIELIVLHSISLPPGEYGGPAVEQLFTNRLDCDAHPYFDGLRALKVSAHFVVRRDGRVQQFVGTLDRAWHAGVSRWNGRDNCNDVSIGIELEGLEGLAFETAQYERLATLMRVLRRHHPITEVVGHQHVAPGRKGDPGAGFDWLGLKQRMRWPASYFPTL